VQVKCMRGELNVNRYLVHCEDIEDNAISRRCAVPWRPVRELVRIAKGDVFVTISLRRSGLDPKRGPTKVHLTVKPREWWQGLFEQAGCEVNAAALVGRCRLTA